MKTLVIALRKDTSKPGRVCIVPNDIAIGWRTICQNGEPYDMFWGLVTVDSIDATIFDIQHRRVDGPINLLDLRERPSEIRHRYYYEALEPKA